MNDIDAIRKLIEAGPRIEYKSDGVWKELYGHACHTLEEAEAYCAAFGPTFRVMKPEGQHEQQ